MWIQTPCVVAYIGFVGDSRKPQTARMLGHSSADIATAYDQLLRNRKERFRWDITRVVSRRTHWSQKVMCYMVVFILEFRVTSSSTGRKVIIARGKEREDTCHSGARALGKVPRLWNSSVCGSDRNLYVWQSD